MLETHWLYIAELKILDPEKGSAGPCELEYQIEYAISYLDKRDLLNIIFGNSDNHGCNTSFFKKNGNVFLSPIYDFAPMKADPEHLIRSTTWGSPYEERGEYQWEKITERLAPWCDPDISLNALKSLADKLGGLKQRLIGKGVPEQIIEMPAPSFDDIEAKLKRWKLL